MVIKNKTMNKLYNFKSNNIKRLKKIIEFLNLKKIVKAKYNVSVVIVVVIIVSICTNIAWNKMGSINYFFREAKQEIAWLVDFKKPVISEVNVSNISEHNAKITWKTNELTKTKFYLGTDTDYTLWQKSFGRMAYDHWLNELPSLNPGMTYYFKIVATDRRGNKTEYDDYTFDTLGEEAILDTIPINNESINNKKANDNNQNLIKPINDTGDIIKKLKPEPKEKINLCLNVNCLDCQYCSFGSCVDYCQGANISCGCIDCINCDSSDNWVNVDSSYSCCNENKNCTCQKQEYRDYTCSGTTCVYSVSETRINKNSCTDCDSSKICLGGVCKDIYSTSLYPGIIIGAFVHQLSFSFSNNSSKTITVTKVEFFNKDEEIKKTISKTDIAKMWQSGELKSEKLFSGNFILQIPYPIEEIKKWQIKWHCIDSYGNIFIVSNLD